MQLFDWDDANRTHIALHHVSTQEAEQASLRFPLELDSYTLEGEVRFEEVGQTQAGRILKLVSTVRGERVRIITAYDAPLSLRKLFLLHQVTS